MSLYQSLTLPNGAVLPNRIAKAAMEENLADAGHLPGEQLLGLYRQWAAGGVGMMLTGNVMIDHMAMTGPGGVALEAETPLEPFKAWAKAGKAHGAAMWMQINHPGRQVWSAMNGKALAPSAVQVDLGKQSSMMAQPRAMTENEIQDVIQRFVITSTRAVEAGFDGVQIHAAHGYLLAQFLSPISNKRDDQWGGSLGNRARLLYEVVKAVREALPSLAALSVKINSADFQRGGFEPADAEVVVLELAELGVDLIELSGGSYESPAMQGRTADGRTLAREAYFLEFAEAIAKTCSVPLMTTGGIRRKPVVEQVLKAGVSVVGIGTALSYQPDLPNQWRSDDTAAVTLPEIRWKNKNIAAMAQMAIVKQQFIRMGKGKLPSAKPSPLFSLLKDQAKQAKLRKIYRQTYS
jgi:2,4-dienoyl-CoA reductase-like NADH-dependent reductase (Old Yellow Enzyme family)